MTKIVILYCYHIGQSYLKPMYAAVLIWFYVVTHTEGSFDCLLLGGVVAPNQGLFPKYDSGLYTDRITNIVVSRGLGNSIIPFRFNNRPEVVLVELNVE